MQSTINTLAKDGFISGFGRAWVQQSPSRVMVEIVVAFTGGDGAKQWLQQSQDADMTDPTFQHSITVDGIETYYGARMSDSSSYFADAFLFVKGNDGFLVSTISGFDDLGDSAAAQTRVQYRHAPAYTIPPSGWPGAKMAPLTIANAAALAPRVTAWLVAGAAGWGARRFRVRPFPRGGAPPPPLAPRGLWVFFLKSPYSPHLTGPHPALPGPG